MLKQYHILNGDCLFKIFPKNLQGEIIIWREALIDGPVSRDNFFQNRERFISENYSAEGNYSEMVLKEFEKISNISENEKVFLWFEEDAFCQVNLWFLLAEIQHHTKNFCRVLPDFSAGIFDGFSNSNGSELEKLFSKAVSAEENDLKVALELWKSFQAENLSELEKLSSCTSAFFPNLKLSVQSVLEIKTGKISEIIREIANETHWNFDQSFRIFSKKCPQYGLGDLQFKTFFDKIRP